jgi:hypothetical protein
MDERLEQLKILGLKIITRNADELEETVKEKINKISLEEASEGFARIVDMSWLVRKNFSSVKDKELFEKCLGRFEKLKKDFSKRIKELS